MAQFNGTTFVRLNALPTRANFPGRRTGARGPSHIAGCAWMLVEVLVLLGAGYVCVVVDGPAIPSDSELGAEVVRELGGERDSNDGRVVFNGINHVRCRADDREATVLCLWWGKPRYVVEFLRDRETVDSGHTGLLTQAARAVDLWIESGSIEELHRQFSFFDQPARAFEAVRNEATLVGLDQPVEVRENGPALAFERGSRGCRILLADLDGNLDVSLDGDGVELFAHDIDDIHGLCRMAHVWLVEAVPPTAMRTRFERLVLPGSLADWRVLQDFAISWDFLVRSFVERNSPKGRRTLELIAQLRARGFDQTLRAGSSLSAVVLSRARSYGLRDDQPCVELDVEQGEILMRVNSTSWDAPHQRLPAPDLADLPEAVLEALHELELRPLS